MRRYDTRSGAVARTAIGMADVLPGDDMLAGLVPPYAASRRPRSSHVDGDPAHRGVRRAAHLGRHGNVSR